MSFYLNYQNASVFFFFLGQIKKKTLAGLTNLNKKAKTK